MIDYVQGVIADTAIKPGFRKYFDMTGLSQVEVTEDGLTRVSEIVKKNPTRFINGQTAVVAPEPITLAAASFYLDITNNDSWLLGFFVNPHHATSWLGIDMDEIDKTGCRQLIYSPNSNQSAESSNSSIMLQR